MPLNLLKNPKNKFLLQAYIFAKIKTQITDYLNSQYPELKKFLKDLNIFVSLNTKNQIKILITSQDVQLITFLKTEIISLQEHLETNLDENLKDKEILILIKNQL
jgi:hypothetical protein